MLVRRKTFRSIQQIHGITFDAVGARLASGGLSHHLKLLRQVDDGDLYIVVVTHALQSPAACVTAHVEQGLWFVGKHNFQGLLE